jgi:hypothetical protein
MHTVLTVCVPISRRSLNSFSLSLSTQYTHTSIGGSYEYGGASPGARFGMCVWSSSARVSLLFYLSGVLLTYCTAHIRFGGGIVRIGSPGYIRSSPLPLLCCIAWFPSISSCSLIWGDHTNVGHWHSLECVFGLPPLSVSLLFYLSTLLHLEAVRRCLPMGTALVCVLVFLHSVYPFSSISLDVLHNTYTSIGGSSEYRGVSLWMQF